MLEVVENEQEVTLAELVGERLERRERALRRFQALVDRPGHETGIGNRVQSDEVRAVGETVRDTAGRLERKSGFAHAARAGDRDEPAAAVDQQAFELGQLGRTTDEQVERCGDRRSRGTRPGREALAEEQREVVLDQAAQLVRVSEDLERDVSVVHDLGEQCLEAPIALGSRLLHVQKPGEPPAEAELVLQSGDVHVGRDPAVAVAVDSDKDVALLEVASVQLPRRVRPGSELEEHGRQA